MNPNYRLVGILGGMGPAATVDFMDKIVSLCPAKVDQEHIPLIVWNVPQIPPRAAAIEDENAPSPLPSLLKGARALRDAGANAIAIVCNTAHFWADEINAEVDLPLIHIADATLKSYQSMFTAQSRSMLLATGPTARSGIYTSKARELGVNLELPNDELQGCVDRAITMMKSGDICAAQAALMPKLIALHRAGTSTFLLACTELPLVFHNQPLEQFSVSSTQALAQAVIDFSTGCS